MLGRCIIKPIRFESEIQRTQHPQAGLIPLPVWVRYFSEVFTEAQLKIMTTPCVDISMVLTLMLEVEEIRPTGSAWSLGLKTQEGANTAIWLAIVFAHAENITDETLLACAKQLDFTTPARLLSLAAACGRLSLFQSIFLSMEDNSKDRLTRILKEQDNFMVAAVFCGHMEIIEYVLKCYPNDVLQIIGANECLSGAVAWGDFSVMKRLFELAGSQGIQLIEKYGDSALRAVVRRRETENLQWLLCFPSTFYCAAREMQRDQAYPYIRSIIEPFVRDKLDTLQARQIVFEPTLEKPDFTIEDVVENQLYYEIIKDQLSHQPPSPEITARIQKILTIRSFKNKVLEQYENDLYCDRDNPLIYYAILYDHFDVLTVLLQCQRSTVFSLRGCENLLKGSVAKINAVFRAIPENIKILYMGSLQFSVFYLKVQPEENIVVLAGSLPYVETVHLNHYENSQDEAFWSAYRAIFSDCLKKTFFVDPHDDGKTFGLFDTDLFWKSSNPTAMAKLAIKRGFPAEFPSLQAQAAFFAFSRRVNIPENLPDATKNSIENAGSYGRGVPGITQKS